MILSNQIECKKCGDRPYSAHRHDFKYCKCKSVAVDGGMDYLKRVGSGAKELSIVMDDNLCTACLDSIGTPGKNALGILCGLVRTIRDKGYEIRRVNTGL